MISESTESRHTFDSRHSIAGYSPVLKPATKTSYRVRNVQRRTPDERREGR
jgi:hypothetical protein